MRGDGRSRTWQVAAAVAALAVGPVLTGCRAGDGTARRPADSARLAAYGGCADLLAGLRRATAAHVGPYGLAGDPMMRPLATGRIPGNARAGGTDGTAGTTGGTAVGAGAAHSATNVQEPGVDEPDLVKTDGRRIVTITGGRLRVIDAAARKQTGTLDLSAHRAWSSGELLLHGDRVLVVLRPALVDLRGDVPGGAAPVLADRHARLVLADIAGPPKVIAAIDLDGSYLDARLTGSRARVVVRSALRLRFPMRPSTPPSAATAANREIVRRAPIGAWLPRYTLTQGGAARQVTVPCDRVSHPPAYAGTSLLSILTIDLAGDMSDTAPIGLIARGDTVYGSGDALYVTDRPVSTPVPAPGGGPPPGRTSIYEFDVAGAGPPRFAASGSVPGTPLHSYALSAYNGALRVVTTSRGTAAVAGPAGATPAPSESAVHVLRRRGDRLVQVGMVGGLGQGESVYAVRFAGPLGYVATFRRTDPLYTLDLRDPEHPRVAGKLKINGYSTYLHPVGDGRLIGVGQDADARGRTLGTRIALFDVRDPAAPREVSAYRVPGGASAAEYDPHAFLYWPPTGLTVLPVAGTGADRALVLSVTPDRIRPVGSLRVPDGAGGVQRALLASGALWTLSPSGLLAGDPASLTRIAWLPFR